MGGNRFVTQSKEPSSDHAPTVTSVSTPPTDTPDRKLFTIDVNPADSDDAVTALVRNQVALIVDKIHRVDMDIERAHRLLEEAEQRKADLVSEVAKYASFLN